MTAGTPPDPTNVSPADVLPAPDMLREYEAIVPGAAAGIIAIAEEEAAKRARLEQNTQLIEFVEASARTARRGLRVWWYSLAVAMVLTAGEVMMADNNRPAGWTLLVTCARILALLVAATSLLVVDLANGRSAAAWRKIGSSSTGPAPGRS